MGTTDRDGEAHEEGWDCGKERHPVWCLAEEADQEDGGHSARQVRVRLLRREHRQAPGRRHLALPGLREDRRWWRLASSHRVGYPGALDGHAPPPDDRRLRSVCHVCAEAPRPRRVHVSVRVSACNASMNSSRVKMDGDCVLQSDFFITFLCLCVCV